MLLPITQASAISHKPVYTMKYKMLLLLHSTAVGEAQEQEQIKILRDAGLMNNWVDWQERERIHIEVGAQ